MELKAKYQHFEPKIREFLNNHGTITFFLVGVLYDVLTLNRIDSWFNLAQLLTFVILSLTFFILEIFHSVSEINPQKKPLQFIWSYRLEIHHFLLGSLLSSFTMFFIKSGSFISSLAFFLILITLMTLNEHPRFQKLGLPFRTVLQTTCVLAFVVLVVPVFLGKINQFVFLISVGISMVIQNGLYFLIIEKKLTQNPELKKRILVPIISVHLTMVCLYFLNLIPPAPLSVQYMAFYHKVEKQNSNYILSFDRPWWKFWENGSMSFRAQPNDKIFCFLQIFSPAGFSDQVFLNWSRYGAKGWEPWDRVPMNIIGGREEGFRGFVAKTNYETGSWFVRVETQDGREIGHQSFELEKVEVDPNREFRTEIK